MKRFYGFVFSAIIACALSSCSPTAPKEEEQITPLSDASIDSLFSLLVSRIQTLENQESYTDVTAIDFSSLAAGFSHAVKGSPTHVKANIGFVMAKVLSLNGNAEVKKMVDSLQAYSDSIDAQPIGPTGKSAVNTASPETGLFPSLFEKGGITGLGKAMLVSTPNLLLPSTMAPKFPTFITLSYIQNIISTTVMPTLDSCVDALTRLEGVSGPALDITIDNNTTSIDLTDIYVIDGSLRMTRAMMGMMTAYDVDLFTSSTDQTYSWIDQMRDLPSDPSRTIVTVYKDTVYYTWSYGKDYESGLLSDIVRANLARTGFLTLRRSAHAKAYEDMKTAPQKIQAAITALRQETGNQDNDLIPFSDLSDADKDMVDVPQNMIDNGVSDTLANKFRTPETLMAFINQVLSGPYHVNEIIDSGTIDLTVNISAWFTNPVQDLKTIFPKYRVLSAAEQWAPSVDSYGFYYGGTTTFSIDPDQDSLAIDPALISSIDSSSGYYWSVTLKTPAVARVDRDSTYLASPIILVDDAKADLTNDRIATLVDSKLFFPYFNDYTFNNVFPGMTRQKWLDLIWQ